MRQNPPNARFWVYLGSPVKLTLKPGQTLRHFRGGPCDEGWSSEYHDWTYGEGEIRRVYVSDGRDCDGRLTRTYTSACKVENLSGHVPEEEYLDFHDGREIHYPKWESVSSSQRDEYAEAMGY